MNEARTPQAGGDRLAKVIARSGLCSRRDAESWIIGGRVAVNGKVVKTPAFNVTEKDKIMVDGAPLADRQGTRVWLYHKPAGLVVTEKDPEGRPTVFEAVEALGLPRVVSIGRLDINTEGLLLLTNDGGLKRVLELPATGWLRKYRVRAFGNVTQAALDGLKNGIEVEGIKYGPIEARLESERGSNVWLEVALREGKNREVKNVLGALGLKVNRLIRVSYGPFMLGDLPIGGIETVRAKVLRDQLGKRLAEEADVDFDSEFHDRGAALTGKPVRERTSGRGTNTVEIGKERFRFTDRAENAEPREDRGPRHRPSRSGVSQPARRAPRPVETGPSRTIFFEDGREEEIEGKPLPRGERSFADKRSGPRDGERGSFSRGPRSDAPAGGRPKRGFGDKPRGEGGERSFGPKRSFGDKSEGRGPRAGAGDRPKRSFGDKARFDHAEGSEGRPARADRPRGDFAGKPRGAGDRPFGKRPGDGPRGAARGPRPEGGRPPRADNDKPRGGRPGGKPFAGKRDGASASSRPSRRDGPGRPGGGKPGGRPSSGPRGPRRG